MTGEGLGASRIVLSTQPLGRVFWRTGSGAGARRGRRYALAVCAFGPELPLIKCFTGRYASK
jgi:hypothetical protein